MIDLHCHFLPGIDDGAATMEQAIALARAAVDNGIRRAIVTPHLHPGRYENTRASIEAHARVFRQALKQADVPLRVGYAAEVRLAPEILPMIERGEVPFLGELDGYRIMLLEFPHSHIPLGAEKLVAKLLDMKIRPLIAHPERNKDVMRNLDKLRPFTEMDCLLQLTAAAVAGKFGDNALKRAVQLLESDANIVLATDAHNLKARPPMLREGMEAAAEIVGPEAALDMVQRLPGAIVAAQFRKKKQPRAAADEGGPERITAPANDAPASATGAEPCRAAAAPAGAAPDAKSVALQEQWLQYQIQAAVKAALPGAIERFFENGLLQNPQEDIFPEIRNRLGDSLHHYLATQLEQGLGQEVRNEIMADIIGAARSKAYEEFKSRHQNQFERELFFNMLVARKEHEKLVDLMGDLVKLLKLIESYDNSSKLISDLLDLACELR